ncbi:hypothetical protein D3C86_1481450 [compost metagenome]
MLYVQFDVFPACNVRTAEIIVPQVLVKDFLLIQRFGGNAVLGEEGIRDEIHKLCCFQIVIDPVAPARIKNKPALVGITVPEVGKYEREHIEIRFNDREIQAVFHQLKANECFHAVFFPSYGFYCLLQFQNMFIPEIA